MKKRSDFDGPIKFGMGVLIIAVFILYQYLRFHACMEIFNNYWYCSMR